MHLTSSDTYKRTPILVYKFRPKRTGFDMYANYTRPQSTFLAPLINRIHRRYKNVIDDNDDRGFK